MAKSLRRDTSDVAFANVTPATEICFFDDADEKFDTTRLFSRTTGDFYVRRMRKIPSPSKQAMLQRLSSSNYPLGENDNSTPGVVSSLLRLAVTTKTLLKSMERHLLTSTAAR